jgi:limonene-1,2-epoxide hydrolase
MSRAENIAVVESYLKGLASKDLSSVPFAPDVTFEGPQMPKLAGRETIVGFLTSIFPFIKGIEIKQHIVDGDCVATVFDIWRRLTVSIMLWICAWLSAGN